MEKDEPSFDESADTEVFINTSLSGPQFSRKSVTSLRAARMSYAGEGKRSNEFVECGMTRRIAEYDTDFSAERRLE